ncbi:unnamed protein product, partial [Polarella glacialis]
DGKPPAGPISSAQREEMDRATTMALVGELIERCLHCRPVYEPQWLVQSHEKLLRTCVHASSPEGLLRAMHVSARLLAAATAARMPSSGAGVQVNKPTAASCLRAQLRGAAKSADQVRAVIVTAALAQRDCCACETSAGPDWKCRCEVIRGLPLFCLFNKPSKVVALVDVSNWEPSRVLDGSKAVSSGWALLPETCPDVTLALRAADVDLASCAEIPISVLSALSSQESNLVASLLRELALPRLRWSELLVSRVLPWALSTKELPSCQALMLAMLRRWRDMELVGNEPCVEALQRVPFVGTVGGEVLSPSQVLDPATEKLRSLYFAGNTPGPFPEARFRYRTELSYHELSERLGLEVVRRDGDDEKVSAEVTAVSEALVRYVVEHVAPAVADLDQDQVPLPAGKLYVNGCEAKHHEVAASALHQQNAKTAEGSGFWKDLTSFLGNPKEGAGAGPSAEEASKLNGKTFSDDELLSIKSKLRPAPTDWPSEAPWKGDTCGLVAAEEVRLFSESFLVGMVRPLVGVTSAQPRGIGSGAAAGIVERPSEEAGDSCLLATHVSWFSRCLYDHVYPGVFDKPAAAEEAKKLWVPAARGFVPSSRIARQAIEFPPYLVRAPAEWSEKIPEIWSRMKDNFAVADCVEALRCIQEGLGLMGETASLDPLKMDMAVRLVMAISDMVQHDRASAGGGAAGRPEILMPTSECKLRFAQECVFNNMTWLPDVETSELSLGTYALVHSKISHAVAHTCGCRGLSLVYAREATEMAGADWCEAAGQSEPITTRLKNLLKDYPADISMFKELVQNADDAGASRVHFVWDWRQHRKQSLLTPDMDRWQGPCLWIFNDSKFSSKDFQSICRLGVGGKREESRKIGRFGLGFNSVYNFTDLPSILSDDMVLFLDPHVHHLSAMGASVQKPGIKLRFLKINVLDKFRDQFEPYHRLLGCDLASSSPFEGTLVRVPFRTPELAKASEISGIAVDRTIAEELSSQFRSEAYQWLLFLQNVAQIELSEIREGMCRVQLAGPSRGPAPAEDGTPPRQSLHRYRLVGGSACGLQEQVCVAVPLQNALDEHLQETAPPSLSQEEVVVLGREEGRLFCFLPLPRTAVSLRLAVHVHAPVNTTQDRRNILLDDRVGDRELIKKNIRLLDVRIPECLARTVFELSGRVSAQDLFRLFPVLHRRAGSTEDGSGEGSAEQAAALGVADRAAQAFYRLFPVAEGGEATGSGLLFAARGVLVWWHPLPHLWHALALESFEQVLHPAQPRVLTPAWLRQFLRAIAASSLNENGRPSFKLREVEVEAESITATEEAAESITATEEAAETVPVPRPKRKAASTSGHGSSPVKVGQLSVAEAVSLLEFALSDGDHADLEGVPLLISEDLSAGTFAFEAASEKGAATLFVPEDEEEYHLLPQAPGRLISRQIRQLRPLVWQQLRHMATASEGQLPAAKTPSQPAVVGFQLRRMTVEPLMLALQDLLPRSWNAAAPEVSLSDWQKWVEQWLQALWAWLNRMSVPTQRMMHWPLVPSLEPLPQVPASAVPASAEKQEGGQEASSPPLFRIRLHKILPQSILFSALPPIEDDSP